MKRLLSLLVPLLLAACAGQPSRQEQAPAIDGAASLRDERPAAEKQTAPMSYLVTANGYGILRLGAVSASPATLDELQRQVRAREGADARIVVHHFVTYLNQQAQLRANVGSRTFLETATPIMASYYRDHPTPAMVAQHRREFEGAAGGDEWRRGTFLKEENPSGLPAYVSYLDADVNGREVFVRVLTPVVMVEGGRPSSDPLRATMQAFLDQLAAPAPASAAEAR